MAKTKNQFKFKAKVWIYPGLATWRFVNLPKGQSQGIMKLYHGLTAGFGSLPVNVTVGQTKWKTSIFPDKKNGIYMLPIKRKVREAEGIKDGNINSYNIEIIV